MFPVCGKMALVMFLAVYSLGLHGQSTELSIDGFSQWRIGHDLATKQLLPVQGNDPLVIKKGKVVVHVKFKVNGYGEMSFPIDPQTPDGEEARKVDLSRSKYVCITYKATHDLILQLRQTGVHGGTHNRVTLPASKKFITREIFFPEFTGGKTPLDLSDVAKFNFAFLGKADKSMYTAELIVRSLVIDQYKPMP